MNDLERAIEFLQKGQLGQAEQLLVKIVDSEPRNFDASHMLGVLYSKQKKYGAAENLFRKSTDIDPSYPPLYQNYGLLLAELMRFEEAIEKFNIAIRLAPAFPPLYSDRGNAFKELGQLDKALADQDHAIRLAPQFFGFYNNRGNVLISLKKYDKALIDFDRAASINPNFANAHCGRGDVLYALKRYDDALAAYNQTLAIDRNFEGAWLGRGNVFSALHRDAEALQCYDKAIDLRQDFSDAHLNKALLKLSLGEYKEGWELHEWRWKTDPSLRHRNFIQPLWLNDSDIGGKTLLVHAEQGLGDTIQFSRYLQFLMDTGSRIVFEIQKPLVSLFQAQRWNCEVVAQGDPLPVFDLHCPLLSLPLAFQTTVETIPGKVPYLDTPQSASGVADLAGQSTKPKIGIAWSGNPNFARGSDTSRPIPLSALSSIMIEQNEWYRLQTDLRDTDSATLNNLPFIKDFSTLLKDFSDTATLVDRLDLIISIDTSVAHLAGAMGKPVWVLLSFNPDFRWLRHRTDSPWYPTARLYRQSKDGDWTDVLESVTNDLRTVFMPKDRRTGPARS